MTPTPKSPELRSEPDGGQEAACDSRIEYCIQANTGHLGWRDLEKYALPEKAQIAFNEWLGSAPKIGFRLIHRKTIETPLQTILRSEERKENV
jgi:hypothetical protein